MPGLAGETANLIVALKLDDSGFTGKLNAAAKSLKGMDRGISQIGRGAGQIGTGIDKIATRVALAGAAAGAFVVTTAASFEQAEAGIRKTVGGTTEEVDLLVDSIKDMSRRVPLSFEELAAITAEGGALGIANKNLDEFTEIIARLSVSTDLTVEQATTSLGKLANVLKLEDAQLQDFGDMLVALGNDGASTESEILALTERFGAAGNQAGLSNAEILALSSTVASMGIEAEAGGGALSRLFNNVTTDIGTMSDEGQALADNLGLSFAELKARWDRDAGGVFEDLLVSLSEMDKFQQAQVLSDLGITNTRDINAIQLLTQGVDEYQRQLGVAEGQTDELNKESDVFFKTTAGKWEILKNNVRLAADTIGSELLPIANELMDEFVGWLNQPATQSGIKDFATNLAEGIRGLADEMRKGNFDSLFASLKGAAEFAKGALDAFMALPADVRNILLGFIAINKVTGGAVGDLTKGLGNLAAGGIKLLFDRGAPGNPMFVTVTNPGFGGPGGPGAGGKGRGGGVLGLLGGVFAVSTAAMLADEFDDEIDGLREDIGDAIFPGGAPLADVGNWLDDLQWPFGPKGAPDWAKFDPEPTSRTVGGGFVPKGNEGGTGTSEWARGLDEVKETFKSGTAEWAAGLTRVENEIATLPDTSMLAPAVNALTGNLPVIRSKADQTLAAQYQALSAARGTTAEVSRLANTPHNVNVDTHVSVNTTVGLSMINMYQTRQRTATTFAESTNSGGV